MTGAGTVQTGSASDFETLYAGYRWDGESPQMYYVRNRFLLPVIGTWNRRDPLGYVDGMNLTTIYFQLSSTDPLGLNTWTRFERTDTGAQSERNPPGSTFFPGETNCAGYALDPSGEGIGMNPTGSLIGMAEGVGQTCYVGITANDCMKHCLRNGFGCHTMGYLYVLPEYSTDEKLRIREILRDLGKKRGLHVMAMNFEEMNVLLCKDYGYCRGGGPLDFHFLKGDCDKNSYKYQPCGAAFGSEDDCRAVPMVFTPSVDRPDYFFFPKGVGRMCCCSDTIPEIEVDPAPRPGRGFPHERPGVRRM